MDGTKKLTLKRHIVKTSRWKIITRLIILLVTALKYVAFLNFLLWISLILYKIYSFAKDWKIIFYILARVQIT